MPTEIFIFNYTGRQLRLNVSFMKYDYGKYNGYFFIREIDEIFQINWSKKKSNIIKSTFSFKSLKPSIAEDFFDEHILKQTDCAFKRLDDIPGTRRRLRPFTSKTRPQKPTIVKYIANCEDDDDEILVNEIGVLEYFYKCANCKKHPTFESEWNNFLTQIRSPSNVAKMHLNKTCIDLAAHVKLCKKIPIDSFSVEFILFAFTQTMMKKNNYLITATCDTNLTISHLNQNSEEEFHIYLLVPVLNVDKVYIELMEFIEQTYKPPHGRIRKQCKIFYLENIHPVQDFVEASRTCKEFVK